MILHSHPSHMNVKPFSGQRWCIVFLVFLGGGGHILWTLLLDLLSRGLCDSQLESLFVTGEGE